MRPTMSDLGRTVPSRLVWRQTRVIPIIDDDNLSDLIILIGHRKTGLIFSSNRNRKMAHRSVNHIVETIGVKAGGD